MTRTGLNRVSAIDEITISNEIENQEINTPSPKGFKVRRTVTNKTTAALISDSETAFESDSSILSNASIASNSSSSRRNRKIWSEAEEACLISGVGKHGENWEAILNDSDYFFNGRRSKDLRNKYGSLIKTGTSSAVSSSSNTAIFDIRSVNEKVTEIFIGSDWSSAQWKSSENVPNFETLLADFEKKIAAKQKVINRISPARTPSRFISSLTINSAVKRTKTFGESSQDENDGTPLKKTRHQSQSSPLSLRSIKSTKSTKSTGSNTHEGLLVHSDIDNEEDTIVYPDEKSEPTPEPKSMVGRCIIM